MGSGESVIYIDLKGGGKGREGTNFSFFFR